MGTRTKINTELSREHAVSALYTSGSISTSADTLVIARTLAKVDEICEYVGAEFPELKITKFMNMPQSTIAWTIMEREDGIMLVTTYNVMQLGVNIHRFDNVVFAEESKHRLVLTHSLIMMGYPDHTGPDIYDLNYGQIP